MTNILLLRHGQSTWNAQSRWQGHADPPLTEQGRNEARNAAQRLGAVDAIFASPLQRARHTAQEIADLLGVGPVIILDGLIERDVGAWQGLTTDEIRARYPGHLDREEWPTGWETADAVFERAEAALRAAAATFTGCRLIAVTHGGVLRTINRFLGEPDRHIPNLSGSRVVLTDGQLVVAEALSLHPSDSNGVVQDSSPPARTAAPDDGAVEFDPQ